MFFAYLGDYSNHRILFELFKLLVENDYDLAFGKALDAAVHVVESQGYIRALAFNLLNVLFTKGYQPAFEKALEIAESVSTDISLRVDLFQALVKNNVVAAIEGALEAAYDSKTFERSNS